MDTDLVKSGVGAVIGFALAQLVNLAKLGWDWFQKPSLVIEDVGEGHRILSHSTQTQNGMIAEVYYGFTVRNVGRSLSTGVRFQMLKIEFQNRDSDTFNIASDTASDLFKYTGADGKRGSGVDTIVPSGATLIALGHWREDSDVIWPMTNTANDYYEEYCNDAVCFRFTVAAFDDHANFVSKVLTVPLGKQVHE